MKYCRHCGAEVNDEAVVCLKCGCAVEKSNTEKPVTEKEVDRTLSLFAYVLCIISTVITAFLIIPMAWCIPMTIKAKKIYKGEKECSTSFAICVAIFVNLIAGVLLVIEKEQ